MKTSNPLEIQQCVLTYEGTCVRRKKQIVPVDCKLVDIEWKGAAVEVEPFPSTHLQMKGGDWVQDTLKWVERQIQRITFATFVLLVRDNSAQKGARNTFVFCVDERGLLFLHSTTTSPRQSTPLTRELGKDEAQVRVSPTAAEAVESADKGRLTRPQSPRDCNASCLVPIYTILLQFAQQRVDQNDFRFFYDSMGVVTNERMRVPTLLNERNAAALIDNVTYATKQCSAAATIVLKETATVDGECRVYTLNPFITTCPPKQLQG